MRMYNIHVHVRHIIVVYMYTVCHNIIIVYMYMYSPCKCTCCFFLSLFASVGDSNRGSQDRGRIMRSCAHCIFREKPSLFSAWMKCWYISIMKFMPHDHSVGALEGTLSNLHVIAGKTHFYALEMNTRVDPPPPLPPPAARLFVSLVKANRLKRRRQSAETLNMFSAIINTCKYICIWILRRLNY